MIKLKPLIQELFKFSYEYSTYDNFNNNTEQRFGFNTDDQETYLVRIENRHFNDIYLYYITQSDRSIFISKLQETLNITKEQVTKMFFSTIEFVKVKTNQNKSINSFGIHSTKNFMKVMSTVKTIIDKEVNSKLSLVFSAKEKSRAKLYSTMVDKFAPKQNYIKLNFTGVDDEMVFILIPKSLVNI